MRSLMILAIGVLAGCSYPHPTPLAEPQLFVIHAPYDSVFQASVGALVKWNFVITYADKSSGVIATAVRTVPDDDPLSQVLYPATNCGSRPTGPLGVIDSYRVRLSLALEDLGDSTAFHVVMGASASWLDVLENDADDRLPSTACASAGPFERTLAERILLGLGR